MTQSQILNANFEWLQAGKKEFFPEYKIDNQKTIFDRFTKAKRSTFDRSKFTVVGTPSITDDGIASGFAGVGKYLSIPFEYVTNTPIEVTLKIKTPSVASANSEHFFYMNTGEYTDGRVEFWYSSPAINTNLYFRVAHADTSSTATTRSISLSPNTEYLLKWSYSNGIYKAFYSTDNVTFTQIGADISAPSIKTVTNKKMFFGNWDINADRGFRGSIDLKYVSVKIDGVEVFTGNKTGVDQIKKDDYTVIGTPVISDDGIASGFSTGSALKIPTIDTSKPFKITALFNFTTLGTTRQSIYGINAGGLLKLSSLTDGRLALSLSENTSAWTITEDTPSTRTIKDNTLYYIQLEFTGINYKVNISTDNISYINFITINSSKLIGNGVLDRLIIGTQTASYSSPFLGSIDLNSFKIYVDDQLVYQPTLRIPYTQSKTGSKIVDATYRDRVQDMYEQFGYTHYYTIGDVPEKYNVQVVGNPTLVGGIASGFMQLVYLRKNIDIKNGSEVIVSTEAVVGSWASGEYNYLIQMLSTDNTSIVGINKYSTNLRLNNVQKGGVLQQGNTIKITLKTDLKTYARVFLNDDTEPLEAILDNNLDISYITIGNEKDPANWTAWKDGSINLAKTSITVDGKEVFRGYEPAIVDAYTLQTVPNEQVIYSYTNGFNSYKQTANLDLTQTGAALVNDTVNLMREFKDTNYITNNVVGDKTTTSFKANSSGTWTATGKGILY